jgi:sugar phosphate isomerase/epimerase
MEWSRIAPRLGLNVPYEWWPSAPLLKEIEAAGFAWTQFPSPPPSVLTDARQLSQHASGLLGAVGTSGLRAVLHAPGSLQAGTPPGDRAFDGLLSYATEVGAELVVYHAANFPDQPASEDRLLAETSSLGRHARRAEGLGIVIALENLAPVFPGPDALSFTPMLVRTMANRIDSAAVAVCLDVGHANVVAGLRHTDPLELIEPVLDRTAVFHLHDNLGGRLSEGGLPELDPVRLDLHLPPGRGTVPWERLAPVLGEHSAPLLLEVHPPHRRSAAYLHRRARRVVGGLAAPSPRLSHRLFSTR